MWRYDAQRSAASVNSVPDEPRLLWKRQFLPRQQAWDDPLNLDLMTYDRTFEPIVMDGRLIIGFNDSGKLLALDVKTGKSLWTAYADAPVRLPPVGWRDRIYFCSDDGFLYCVNSSDGTLIWKVHGAPNSQKVIGNRSFASAWPARGGPVVRDDTVYFAASIWPFMGTFIYAIDADTGAIQWVNDSTGAQYIKQPHSAPSFAGVAPQGALVATKETLVVPGGRSVPAVFDRKNGELRYFELNAGGKGTGGSFVAATDEHFFVHTREKGTREFDLATGLKTAFMPNEPVLAGDRVYSAESDNRTPVIRAYDRARNVVWQVNADGQGDLILAKDRLVAGGKSSITIVKLHEDKKPAEVVVSIPTESSVDRLLVAGGMLFAVSVDGSIAAYGTIDDDPSQLLGAAGSISDGFTVVDLVKDPSGAGSLTGSTTTDHSGAGSLTGSTTTDHSGDGSLTGSTTTVIDPAMLESADTQGYAFWVGDASSGVLKALAAQSPFVQMAVVDDDAKAIEQLRVELDQSGHLGKVTAHYSELSDFRAPQYVADRVWMAEEVVQAADESVITKWYESVRPYGGVMHLIAASNQSELAERIRQMRLEQAEVEVRSFGVVVRRVGALPGSADWTHQYGDIANTLKSDDRRVKLPLGVLWFGGNSNMDVLPRHGHGPPEQVVGGRLFIQGMNSLSARDVYTGRVLWKRDFEDLGTFDVYFDSTYEDTPLDPKYNQVHIPGASGRGTNYVVTEDRVYILENNVCLSLDPATGKTLAEIRLPTNDDGDQAEWGYIGVYKNVLLGGIGFAKYRERYELTFETDEELGKSKAGFGSKSLDRAASTGLVGFDRHTGDVLWRLDAKHSFWHNGIVAGDDQIFCLDKNPAQIEEAMRRRGKAMPDSYRIVAVDHQTGKENWSVNEGIFGTWLGYSESHGLLLQAGAKANDRLATEVGRGMTVYHGSDGSVKWKNDSLNYAGPCILHNDLIITNANSYTDSAGAFYLESGEQKMTKNVLTGEMQPWKVNRAYGCNTIIASENLLTFRSGAAGFYDLLTESGTGNLGGFKSGCTSNLVVANGVLNAPDYTRTCSCSYQNQTSLALVHMPEIDVWSVDLTSSNTSKNKPIQQLAINFAAPGDRRDANGKLWLEYPVVTGDEAPVPIELNSGATYFQHHSSSVAVGDRPDSPALNPWLLASGVEGLTDLRIEVQSKPADELQSGIAINHADDDAEENENGEVSLTSSDLELVEDSGSQIVGMRFNNIPLQPKANVRSAAIQFTCDEASQKPTSLSITAENSSHAERFRSVAHDISSRDRVAGELIWKPEPWKTPGEAGELQRTPDVATLVQAIVNRPDWKPGNSIAFLISGEGKRVAAAYKGNDALSARLFIDTDSPAASDESPKASAGHYDIQLHFACPVSQREGIREFDVYAQDKLVLKNVLLDATGVQGSRYLTKTIEGITTDHQLHLRFDAKQGEPVLSGIELIRQERP
jgi:outer membrane protein assembly factor BamB